VIEAILVEGLVYAVLALGVFISVEELISVHGHEGNTHVEFIEPVIVETNQ